MTYRSLGSSTEISLKGQEPTPGSWIKPTNDLSSAIYFKFYSDSSGIDTGVHFELRCLYPSYEVKFCMKIVDRKKHENS